MSNIAKSLTELVSNTPLLELVNFQDKNGVDAHLWAKLEYFNPAGSVKDRVALAMILDAEKSGALKAGGTLIEPTSGNTGVGLAMVAASKGYKLILTMPESMSIERRKLLSALGAELVLTPAAGGMKGAIARAYELQEEIDGSVILNQFENSANPEQHYKSTAEELWKDTEGKLDVLVAGVGTGGTVSGTGKRLKELNPAIEVIAVEPAASPVLSGGSPAPHKIQGIGAGFVPKNYDGSVVDRVVTIANDDAFDASRRVAKQEGILVGISSGAALAAAEQIAKEPKYKGKNIVVILPDGGERYLSTELYQYEG
ncbi:MAG: cysteine synthase A [Rikenellaceae bacterium]